MNSDIKTLLYKEFRLSIHPAVFLFLSFGILLLIPSWPYFIAFGYFFVGIFNTFIFCRANNDLAFTASLPVPKHRIVLARIFSLTALELATVVIAVPFAILNTLINPRGNLAGMNPNIAFFGFVLIMFAIYNAIFFPLFYKTAYKVGGPTVLALTFSLLFAGIVELLVHTVPVMMTNINAIGAGHPAAQLAVLAAGIVLFLLTGWFSYKKSAARFEKVDL